MGMSVLGRGVRIIIREHFGARRRGHYLKGRLTF